MNVENILSYSDFIEEYHSPNNFARSTFGNVTKRSPEENYRVYARECHIFGNYRRMTPPDKILHPRNDPGCPDQDAAAEVWDYGSEDTLDVIIWGRTIRLESDVSETLVQNACLLFLQFKGQISDHFFSRWHLLKTQFLNHKKVDNLVIENGGKLIFKDYGADTQSRLTLRAKSIEIKDGGEMWIGSRTCRYQGLADVVLYGNRADMDNHES